MFLLISKQFEIFKNILIMGIGFKANQTLTAFSPTLKIYEELKLNNKKVTIYDYLNSFTFEDLIKFDCIIVGHIPKSFDVSR